MSKKIVRSLSDDELLQIGIHLERAHAIAKMVYKIGVLELTEVLVPQSLETLMGTIDSQIDAVEAVLMNVEA
jgi:hypothetical protein